MRGVKYVTYAFLGILMISVILSMWFSMAHKSAAAQHADTFMRVLGACSIMLTFVFYYNLIKSQDDARIRAEQLDADKDAKRTTALNILLSEIYKACPHTVLSITEFDIDVKKMNYQKAIKEDEMQHIMDQYLLTQNIFDMWASIVDTIKHRKSSLVGKVARMIKQAASPYVAKTWKTSAYQYTTEMKYFVNTMMTILDRDVHSKGIAVPNYFTLALKVLEHLGHVTIMWKASNPYYIYNECEYTTDVITHFFE